MTTPAFYNTSEKISISTRGPGYMLLPLLMEKVLLSLPLYSQFYSIKLIFFFFFKLASHAQCQVLNSLVVGLIFLSFLKKKIKKLKLKLKKKHLGFNALFGVQRILSWMTSIDGYYFQQFC